ncbi:MAG: hypothetical protein KAI25_02270, partial [Hyphomicrobiaceae bacterium]|nr:hypothetical protein [Hyphomicrobiaceae bacterium]
ARAVARAAPWTIADLTERIKVIERQVEEGAHDKKVGYAIFLFFCPGNCSISYYITSGRSP